MFDTLLLITLFLLASLHVCLLTLCLFFRSLPILTDFLKFHPLPIRPFILTPSFIKFKKDILKNFRLEKCPPPPPPPWSLLIRMFTI